MNEGFRIAAAIAVLATSGCGLGVLTGGVIASSLSKDGSRDVRAPTPVSLTTPAIVVNDRVGINYRLTDPAAAAFDVRVEYSTTGIDGPFLAATEALGAPSQGTHDLTASPLGNPHVFVWNTFPDLDPQGITNSTKIAVRVTASLPDQTAPFGEAATSEPFAVDNRLIATIVGPAAVSGELVTALEVPLLAPSQAVELPGVGVLVVDTGNARVRLRDPTTTRVSSVAGAGVPGFSGDGGQAVLALLSGPSSVSVAAQGHVFIADTANHRIRRVDAVTGVITTVAGTGQPGFTGDGGQAIAAMLNAPTGIVVVGDVVTFSDRANHVIRRVDGSGQITTIAGTGVAGAGADGSPTISAALSSPGALCLDPTELEIFFVADTGNHVVRRFRVGGTMATAAGTLGTAGLGGEGQTATSSALRSPAGVFARAGVLFIADTGNHRLRRVEAGLVTTLAGSLAGTSGFAGDNGAASAALLQGPLQLSDDGAGGLLVADAGNNRIRRLDTGGLISTFAGSGAPDAGNVGDGGPAVDAELEEPEQMCVGADGSIYVADGLANRVRRFTIGGTISTVAGAGNPGFTGDGGLATQALLRGPFGVCVDASNTLFIADRFNARVRAVNQLTGVITTVIGGGAGFDGVGTAVALSQPEACLTLPQRAPWVIAPAHAILVADARGHRIIRLTYEVDPQGNVINPVVDTVCGTGVEGNSPDGTLATAADIFIPLGIDYDSNDFIYIYDQFAANVRRFQLGGTLETVCGDPTGLDCSYAGDGGPAVDARTCGFYLAVDRQDGDFVYLADYVANRVRRFQVGGIIDTVAGNGLSGDSGLGGPATGATLALNSGVNIMPDGSIITGAQATRRVYQFTVGGTIDVIAGRAAAAVSGEGGPAVAATLNHPIATVGPDGAVYIAEALQGRLRRVDPITGLITTVVGQGILGLNGNDGPLAEAFIDAVFGLAVDASGDVFIVELNQSVVRKVDVDADRISIVAGNGSFSAAGDGGQAKDAGFVQPIAVAFSAATGAMYVADFTGNSIRRIGTDGIITTVAGGGGDTSDGVLATDAELVNPVALAVGANETIYVAQAAPAHVVRTFQLGGTIRTLAGVFDQAGYNGDSIPGAGALLNNPQGVAVDAQGNVFVADSDNQRIRRINTAGFISTVAGTGEIGSGPDGVPPSQSRLNAPRHITIDTRGNLYVAEEFGRRVRRFRTFP